MRERSRWSFSASRKRGQVILRHPKHSAYRCFLPDLAGLAGERRVRPMPDQNYSSIRIRQRLRRQRLCDFRCKKCCENPSFIAADNEQCS